jgi:hypothetical protein
MMKFHPFIHWNSWMIFHWWNSSWNIMKVHISNNCFIHQPWMFSSSLISHSWKLMLLQFGNNSSMYIDDFVACFIRQQTFHFVHQFHPSCIWMMRMMRMDDDSSLYFHYQMGLNLTSFIQIGCQRNIKFQVLKNLSNCSLDAFQEKLWTWVWRSSSA